MKPTFYPFSFSFSSLPFLFDKCAPPPLSYSSLHPATLFAASICPAPENDVAMFPPLLPPSNVSPKWRHIQCLCLFTKVFLTVVLLCFTGKPVFRCAQNTHRCANRRDQNISSNIVVHTM